ncbi:MAG: UDP-N-acetylmuramate dehydrogenase, partial [Bacillota bacterium]|nr:UDP-N-acetylmuramate dehydrogenase [Bacillota bacterium]
MSDLTTFKIGGVAKHVFLPKSTEEVSALVRDFRKAGQPYFVLGNGSNVLMPDEEIEFPIIWIGDQLRDIQIHEDGEIVVGAGMLLATLVLKALEHSLTGIEFAHCIPGTVGGAAYMNAGAFNGEMKDIIRWIEYVDAEGKVFVVHPDESFFGYRYSKAQTMNWIVTRVCVKLEKGDRTIIKERMDEIGAKRSAKQPLEYPSAGSVFKRPKDHFASKLIDEAGLKGYQIGGARVSDKHGGFIVNMGGATCGD